MLEPDIYDRLRAAVEQVRVNDKGHFTIAELKSAVPELLEYERRNIIEALQGLSRELRIEEAGVRGEMWNFS